MRYWKPLLFLFIVLIAVGCVVLYFATAPSATPVTQPQTTSAGSTFGQPAQNIPLPNQTSSPTAFTINFYNWYLQGLINNQKFTSSDQFKSTIGGWLTPDFASNWNGIAGNTGSDPVLLSQDYRNSWLANIQATVINQSATASTVLVSLGTSTELKKMTVSLVLVNNVWRIAAVASAE